MNRHQTLFQRAQNADLWHSVSLPTCSVTAVVDLRHQPLTSVCLHVPQSLWIERTTLILSRPLPGISRWAEVERREVVRSSGSRDHATLDA